MLQFLKVNRMMDLKNQSAKLKAEATKAMEAGDLKTYFDKIKKASELQREFSETLHIKD